MPRLLRACLREIAGLVLRLGAYVGLLAALAIGVAKVMPAFQQAAAVPTQAKSEWSVSEHPIPAFALDFPGIADPNPGYAILRSADGSGRKDVLTFAAGGKSASVEIYRPGVEQAGFGDPLREVSARTVGLGDVRGFAIAAPVESKFGPVAMIDFYVGTGPHRRGCVGFARTIDEPRFQIAGWACNPGPTVFARPAVSCALDRLSLLMAASEPRLAALFARAELDAGFCGRARQHGGTTGPAANWIDARRNPLLKGDAAPANSLSPDPAGGYSGEYRLRMRAL